MTDVVFRADELSKRFDGVTALDSFSCSVRQREIVGLIGPNGGARPPCST